MILEDDKQVFPAGNVIFVTTPTVAKKAGPDYEKTIVEVQKGLTLPVMQELDARVELEKQTPKEAAAAYLEVRRLHRLGSPREVRRGGARRTKAGSVRRAPPAGLPVA